MTAARLRVRMSLLAVRALTPSRSSMPGRLCWVKIERLGGVAGVVGAGDQPMADQHIVAHALEIRDVLEADRLCRGRRCEKSSQAESAQPVFHAGPIPCRTMRGAPHSP